MMGGRLIRVLLKSARNILLIDSEGVLRKFIISTTQLIINIQGWYNDLWSMSSLSLADVEAEEDDIAVLDHVLLALLHVLALRLHRLLVPQRHQVVVFHDLRADEALLEVSVDHSRSLGSLGQLADGPAAHLVSASSEVVDEVEGVVARLDDLGNHGALLVVLVLQLLAFVLGTVGDDLSGDVVVDPLLDLLEPLVLLAHEVLLAEVDQVDHGLGSDEAVRVQLGDLRVAPLAVTHPLVLLQQFLRLHQDLLLLARVLGVGALDDLLDVLQTVVDVLEVLQHQLAVDDVHVAHGVHRVLSVRDLLVLEGPHHVEDAVDFLDVAQEVVAQSLALGRSAHDSGDINNLQDGRHLGLGVVHFAELAEAVVRDGDDCLVGVDGAEGVVLGGDVEVGEDVVGGGLAHVGQPHDTHAQRVARPAPQDLLVLLLVFLLGRHAMWSQILDFIHLNSGGLVLPTAKANTTVRHRQEQHF